MPAVLGNNLVDKLIPVADALRAQLYPAMGVQQYVVTVIRRRWNGGERGLGISTVVSSIALSPPPVVRDSLGYELRDSGLTEVGDITLTEVSLQYTEAELTGQPLGDDEEFLYRLTDARGQGIAPDYFVIAAPPVPDRTRDIGWRVRLKRVEATETA
jgi:hypothetical protein